jgi:hypothetical protein
MALVGSTGKAKKKRPAVADRRSAYKDKTAPYDRSPREFIKRETTPKNTRTVGKSFIQGGSTKAYEKAVQRATTKTEAKGAVKQLKRRAARKTIRRVTKAAVRKGISGPTEDSLGITRQEGGKAVRKAVKVLGMEGATKTATRTRLRKGQTYKGGKGWVSKPSKRTAPARRRKAY